MKTNKSNESVSLTDEQISELIAFKTKIIAEKQKWNAYSKRRLVIMNLLIKKAIDQNITITQKEIDDYIPGTKLDIESAIVPDSDSNSNSDSPTE